MQKWYVCAEIQNPYFCVEGRFCSRVLDIFLFDKITTLLVEVARAGGTRRARATSTKNDVIYPIQRYHVEQPHFPFPVRLKLHLKFPTALKPHFSFLIIPCGRLYQYYSYW